MTTATDIIHRGYLPKELPPLFSTRTLATHYASLPATAAKYSLAVRYSFSKFASVRRTLAIPNPAHFVNLAAAVANNWAAITTHCGLSTLSKTAPRIDSTRAITWANTLDSLPRMRAVTRVGARYALQADVASFYGSIYTHSIPWAFHGKTVAKKNHAHVPSKTGVVPLFGNVLDHAVQVTQYNQTIGIPIGPDTSLPIGEGILSAVDQMLQAQLPQDVRGFRFIDDYEFACTNYTQAERVRTLLEDALAHFELHVNPRKTRIVELPDTLDTPWAQDLAAFGLSSRKQPVLESQLLRYFSRAFELAKQFPGDPVLKYAMRRLSDVDKPRTPMLLQRLLFQTAAADAGTLHTALYVTYGLWKRDPKMLDVDTIRRALVDIICRHAPLQHGGDVVWAIWGAVVFNIALEEPAVAALESLTDPLGILAALYAEHKALLPRPLNRTAWLPLVSAAELFDERWILAYEGFGQGWLIPPGGSDPAKSDPFFEEARKKGVSFIELNAARAIPKPSPLGQYI